MKTTLNIFLILTVSMLILATLSCEENETDISGIEPFFNVKLINQDSIVQLRNEIAEANVQIGIVNDTIKAIEQRIDNGDNTDYTERLDSLNVEKDTLSANKVTFNEIIKVINSGKIKITRLSAAGAAADIVYDDSLTTYRFPLNTYADTSLFYVTIAEDLYTLKATYERETIVEERTVLIRAKNFNIADHTFDSLKLSQFDSTNFSSNEATATVYF